MSHQFERSPEHVHVRQARSIDIARMHRVRLAAREVSLGWSPPTAEDYRQAILDTGRGWVAEVAGAIRGFVIGNRENGHVSALFVDPRFEGQGVGRVLHEAVVEWLLTQGCKRLWLRAARDTRIEQFCRDAGWRCTPKGRETLCEFFPASPAAIERRYEAR